MGTFRVGCKVENHLDRSKGATVSSALVDTRSEYTWVPEKILERIGVSIEKKDLAFTMANGQQITRNVGFAIIRINNHFTIDEVVFAEPGDLTLLGARTLEGLSVVVDSQKRKLVAAGPIPAA
jgi:predicted aspartyl protease